MDIGECLRNLGLIVEVTHAGDRLLKLLKFQVQHPLIRRLLIWPTEIQLTELEPLLKLFWLRIRR